MTDLKFVCKVESFPFELIVLFCRKKCLVDRKTLEMEIE